jgi:biotin transport system substrate-specific component
MMKNHKISIRELCYIAVFTAIITVCSQISIPLPVGVPMTLQTFAIPLAGMILGKKHGTLSTVIYVLLGLVGVPVFAGFAGGLGTVFGRTGGFILSFPIMALLAGIGNEKNNNVWLVSWLVLGAAVNYLCGALMFSFVASTNLITSFVYVVVPFIPTSIVKIALVALVGKSVKAALIKNKLLTSEK